MLAATGKQQWKKAQKYGDDVGPVGLDVHQLMHIRDGIRILNPFSKGGCEAGSEGGCEAGSIGRCEVESTVSSTVGNMVGSKEVLDSNAMLGYV